MSASDPMGVGTLSEFLEGAGTVAGGEAEFDRGVVLDGSSGWATVTHSFDFVDAYQVDFQASDARLNEHCPSGEGVVIEALQNIQLELDDLTLSSVTAVRLYVGIGDTADDLIGHPAAGLAAWGGEVAAVGRELEDAVAAAYGPAVCGTDAYYLGQGVQMEPWGPIRTTGYLGVNRPSCSASGGGYATVVSVNLLDRQPESDQGTKRGSSL